MRPNSRPDARPRHDSEVTEPDPHTFVVSRRALRERAERSFPDAATSDVSTLSRRSRRRLIVARQDLERPVVFAAGHWLRDDVPARMPSTTLRRGTATTAASMPPGTESRVEADPVEPLPIPAPPIGQAPSQDAATKRVGVEPRGDDVDDSTPIWATVRAEPFLPQPPAAPAEPELAALDASEAQDAVPGVCEATHEARRIPEPSPVRRPAASSRPSKTPAIFKPPPPPAPVVYAPLLEDAQASPAVVRHARRRSSAPLRLGIAAAVVSAVLVGGSAAMTAAAATGAPVAIMPDLFADVQQASAPTTAPTATPVPPPAVAAPVPTPTPEVAAAPGVLDLCATPAVVDALSAGDDIAAVAAAGGAEPFRSAIASGAAACVDLGDPARTWVVIDKARPLNPVDYAPASLASAENVRTLEDARLRPDASAAMSALVAAAGSAGAGEIAVQSAYRSYDTQVTSYGNQVSDRGTDGADLVSARPGFSEHQSGLAADVVACNSGCGGFDDFAATAQGQWVADHAWEYGWIVRYQDGHTDVTGYSPEPWHLRYIGVDLARAYHDGGWHTLEEFFGLPAAPDYAD